MAAKRKKKTKAPTTMRSFLERIGWRVDVSGTVYYGKHIRVSIHRHIQYPGKWLLSCYELHLTNRELAAADFDAAVIEAFAQVRATFADFEADLTDMEQADRPATPREL